MTAPPLVGCLVWSLDSVSGVSSMKTCISNVNTYASEPSQVMYEIMIY